jgi:hypothetical protein
MAAGPPAGLPPALSLSRRAAVAALMPWPLADAAAQAEPAPSLDTPMARRLAAIAPQQVLRLGPARVLGEFNDTARRFELDRTGPRARDFSRKMVWAPERRRALFAGANHGGPHRLNDVWEFDLEAHAWTCLYAPDLPRSYGGLGPDASDVVFRDGVLTTRRGGPAVVGHTWSGLTYDPRERCMLFMNTWPIDVDALVRQVGHDPAERYRGPPLWRFTPATRTWSLVRTEAPWPKAAVGALLEDVPELGGAVWHLNNWQLSASWLLDVSSGRWKVIADARSSPGFATQAPGRELVGYLDPRRRLLVAQCRRDTFHFDLAQRRWSRTVEADGPDGHDAYTGFYHHPGSGEGLLVDFRDGRLWAYSPDQARWRALNPRGDTPPAGARVLAYVDAARDLLVIVDGTQTWAYRHA